MGQMKVVTRIEGGVEVSSRVPVDAPAEPTQEQLAQELRGAVFTGHSQAGTSRWESYIDLRNPRKGWRVYDDGTIERVGEFWTASSDPKPQQLGVIRRHFREAPSMFPAAQEPPKPDPQIAANVEAWESLSESERAVIRAASGLRR